MILKIVFIFFILSFPFPARAFGPHGGGSIGNAIDRAEVPRGFPIYQDYESPYSYPSMTRRDLIPLIPEGEVIEVEGSSKMTGFFIPIGLFFGLGPTSGLSVDLDDRSVRAALADARKRYNVRNLYDLRIDEHYFSILGIYNTRTTIVHAKGVKDINRPSDRSDNKDHPPSSATQDSASGD
jgi:hypothetical protein